MKNTSPNTLKRSFEGFDFRMGAKTAVAFIFEGLLIFLLASIKDFGFAMSLALFCALVYARQNILALAPCFIVASVVFCFSWQMLLYALTPVVLLVFLYMIFFKLKRNVPLFAVVICALLSSCPYAVCLCLFYGEYLLVALSVLFVLIFTFCMGICSYAIFVRGVLHKTTVEEQMCLGISLCVFGYALAGVGGYGFYIVSSVLCFLVLLSSICFKAHATFFVAILLGFGTSLYHKDLTYLASFTALATGAIVFSPFTKWSSALCMIAIEGIEWLLSAYSGAGWQSLCMCCVGIVLVLVMPSFLIAKIKGLSAGDNRRAYTALVNRRGRQLGMRLSSASDVFYDMSKNLGKIARESSNFSAQRLASDVAKSFCTKCSDREICFSALGSDTKEVLIPMAESALNRGKVTILDMPPFITSRCSNMHSLANCINSGADAYRKRMNDAKMFDSCKSMMSEQFAGVALVLDALAEASAEQVSFCGDEVEILKSELLKHNIVASEVVICGEDASLSATLLLRQCDVQKAMLGKIVSRVLRCKMEIARVSDRGELRVVVLECSPTFEVAYGISQKKYDDDDVCGDSTSVLCPSRTRRLFAICDGMGHGQSACEASQNAIRMIESFYRAGIESTIVLNLVNKLLKISADDVFSALDIAVLDVQSGGLDVIKSASASSFIIRKENIEMLSCNSAPMGIVDDVGAVTSRYQLFDGDMLLMMSDGVFDMLEANGVAEMIDSLNTTNPQTLADEILKKALENGARDDCTVLAMRLFTI